MCDPCGVPNFFTSSHCIIHRTVTYQSASCRINIVVSITNQSTKLGFGDYSMEFLLSLENLSEHNSAISDPFQNKYFVFIAHSWSLTFF